MANISHVQEELLKRILDGQGDAPSSERRAAFSNSNLPTPVGGLIDKVARHACEISDEDFRSALKSGLSEDQVFELVVCAAVGQATRQYDAAMEALKMAMDTSAGKA